MESKNTNTGVVIQITLHFDWFKILICQMKKSGLNNSKTLIISRVNFIFLNS